MPSNGCARVAICDTATTGDDWVHQNRETGRKITLAHKYHCKLCGRGLFKETSGNRFV